MSKSKDAMIRVNQAEYEALCELRDGVHENTVLQMLAAKANYDACLAINKTQCARLSHQDLQLTDMRQRLTDAEKRAMLAEKRRDELEPAKLTAGAQPLFSKSELRR